MGTGNCHITGPPQITKASRSKDLKARSRHLSTEQIPVYRWALGPKSTADHNRSQIHWAKKPDPLLSEEDSGADIRTAQVVSASGDHCSAVTRVSPPRKYCGRHPGASSWGRVLVPHIHLGSLALPDGYSQGSESKPLPFRILSGGVLLLQIIQDSVCHTMADIKWDPNNILLVSISCKVLFHLYSPLMLSVTWREVDITILIVRANSGCSPELSRSPLSEHVAGPCFPAPLELQMTMWLALTNETWAE